VIIINAAILLVCLIKYQTWYFKLDCKVAFCSRIIKIITATPVEACHSSSTYTLRIPTSHKAGGNICCNIVRRTADSHIWRHRPHIERCSDNCIRISIRRYASQNRRRRWIKCWYKVLDARCNATFSYCRRVSSVCRMRILWQNSWSSKMMHFYLFFKYGQKSW